MNHDEVCPNDHTWPIGSVDPVTGELIEKVYLGSRYVKPLVIENIVSKDTYDKSIKEVIAGRKYRLWVSPLLLEMVIERQLSPRELGLFCFLGQSIGYNNLVYLSTKEITEGIGYTRETVSKALGALEGYGLIRRIAHKLEGKDDRFYKINPLYFFLGYYPNRDNLLKEWMTGR